MKKILKNKILLWLDDYRNPFDKYWIEKYPILAITKVIWVKSYNEFCDYINKNGLPNIIGFDHDLGVISEYYIENDLVIPELEKNGFDCASFLVNYCLDNNLKIPYWFVQSDNIVGTKNINSLLNNFKKSQDEY